MVQRINSWAYGSFLCVRCDRLVILTSESRVQGVLRGKDYEDAEREVENSAWLADYLCEKCYAASYPT